MPHGLPCPPVAAMTVCLCAISEIYKRLCPALAADGQLIHYSPSCMSRVRFPSPAPTLCDAIIFPQPPVRLRALSNGYGASVAICEAGGRSYAAAENRLPIGNVHDPDLCGFWAGRRRCLVRESCEAMSNESVSCGIFKSN